MDPADYYDDETRSGEPMEGAEGAGPEVDLASVMEVDGGPKSCVCPAEKVDPPDQTKRAPQGREEETLWCVDGGGCPPYSSNWTCGQEEDKG